MNDNHTHGMFPSLGFYQKIVLPETTHSCKGEGCTRHVKNAKKPQNLTLFNYHTAGLQTFTKMHICTKGVTVQLTFFLHDTYSFAPVNLC